MSQPFTVEPRTELRWIGVDLDDTIATSVWPLEGIGPPIERNLVKLREVARRGWKIIIYTARSWDAFENIEQWLLLNDIPFDKIVCGKLLCNLLIDDRSRHPDAASWLP